MVKDFRRINKTTSHEAGAYPVFFKNDYQKAKFLVLLKMYFYVDRFHRFNRRLFIKFLDRKKP